MTTISLIICNSTTYILMAEKRTRRTAIMQEKALRFLTFLKFKPCIMVRLDQKWRCQKTILLLLPWRRHRNDPCEFQSVGWDFEIDTHQALMCHYGVICDHSAIMAR